MERGCTFNPLTRTELENIKEVDFLTCLMEECLETLRRRDTNKATHPLVLAIHNISTRLLQIST